MKLFLGYWFSEKTPQANACPWVQWQHVFMLDFKSAFRKTE